MTPRSPSPKEKWESRYRADGFEPNREPVPFLVQAVGELKPGRALCLAAGAGRNAVYLAEKGWAVTAVDISPAGLGWCRRLAGERGVEIETVAADLLSFDFGLEEWDLVTNLYFHEPALFPSVRAALKSGGHFLFQTYAKAQAKFGWGPSNPGHLVEPQELRHAFSGWDLLHFCEAENEDESGRREAVVQLLARKALRPRRAVQVEGDGRNCSN